MKKSSAVWLIISLVLSACSLMAFKSIETNGLHNVVGAETPKSLYKSYNFLDGGDSTDQYYSHTN